jgi:hypothetical protein
MGKSEKHIAALKAALEKKRAEDVLTKHLKIYEAQTLTDKNSRTLVKIMQLLEIIQGPDALKVDSDGHVLQRIEKLKKRYLRRLAKLAKWSDAPEMERVPSYHALRSRALPRLSQPQQQQVRRPLPPPGPSEPLRQSSRLSNTFIPEEKPEDDDNEIEEEGGEEEVVEEEVVEEEVVEEEVVEEEGVGEEAVLMDEEA